MQYPYPPDIIITFLLEIHSQIPRLEVQGTFDPFTRQLFKPFFLSNLCFYNLQAHDRLLTSSTAKDWSFMLPKHMLNISIHTSLGLFFLLIPPAPTLARPS